MKWEREGEKHDSTYEDKTRWKCNGQWISHHSKNNGWILIVSWKIVFPVAIKKKKLNDVEIKNYQMTVFKKYNQIADLESETISD